MKVSILVPLIFGIFAKVSSATPLGYDLSEFPTPLTDMILIIILYHWHSDTNNICDGAITLASTWIGQAKNVQVKSVFCPDSLYQRRDELEQRQSNSTTTNV